MAYNTVFYRGPRTLESEDFPTYAEAKAYALENLHHGEDVAVYRGNAMVFHVHADELDNAFEVAQ
jgi:hypothetical protein